MVAHLRNLGHVVNAKRVRRLLRKMGLEAVYQKPNTSQRNPEHKVYPYLLRGLVIDRCDQVWSTDTSAPCGYYLYPAGIGLCLPDGRD